MPALPKGLKLGPEHFNTPELRRELVRSLIRERYARFPRFWEALEGDAKMYLAVRGEARDIRSRWHLAREAARLSWETDAFLALTLYRARTRLLARGVPALPTLLHKASMVLCQLDIGNPVVMEPGVYVPHGQVVIDGPVDIGKGTVLTPFVTIGLQQGRVDAPKIGRFTLVGTGAKVLGGLRVGARAKIGANAVVVRDVPPGATVTGAPARPVGKWAEAQRRKMAERKGVSVDASAKDAGAEGSDDGDG